MLWRPSPRRLDPHPPRWEYPQGAWVLKVDCQGKLDIQAQEWRVSTALAREWVQVVPVEQLYHDSHGARALLELPQCLANVL
jgi:hypothetical protein